jgi:Na+/phosphate symporter
VQLLEEKEIKKGKKFGKIINSVQEIALNTRSIAQNNFDHVENNHTRLSDEEYNSLNQLIELLKKEVRESNEILDSKDFSKLDEFKNTISDFKDIADSFDLDQITRIKSNRTTARSSLLYLRVSSDIENISGHLEGLITSAKSTFESFSKDKDDG